MFSWLRGKIGSFIASFLEKPIRGYQPYTSSDPKRLRKILKPGDIILVEGNQRISSAIKYLTMSTWSHAAMYVGEIFSEGMDVDDPHCLIEVELKEGCITSPLSKYAEFNTRICRPVGLNKEDCNKLVQFMIENLGTEYDLKNVFDLGRFLFPLPIPVRWRRRMIEFGSGDPTRAICSTLIAKAFQEIQYPILPLVKQGEDFKYVSADKSYKEILHIRHHSLYAPKDFDISPYFQVVKPTIELGFSYKSLTWSDLEHNFDSSDDADINIVDNSNIRKVEKGNI